MTPCPPDDELVRMLEGGVGQATLAHLEVHVDGCEHCASVMAGLGALGSIATADPAAGDAAGLVPADPDHYVLAEEIARGGMGRVMRARDRRLGREIAIKQNFVSSGDQARRFEAEARITARLQHPSIVHIHDAGILPTGEPFFAMQLVSGRSFDEVIADAATLEQRLALVPHALAVADAIAYAHHEGVLHRDLKPRNVIVGDFGETVVIDWGLAKDLRTCEPDARSQPLATGSDPGVRTEVGKVMGTPAYMPPEQARGGTVDMRSDVYALGALLFHMLSGRPPVTGRTTDDVLATLLAGPLPSLAETMPDIPIELLAIVGKAMAFVPADRYPSARELAADLRRFQTGNLVGAHRYSLAQLVRRWLRRHRTAVTVAVAAAAVLVAVGIVSVRQIVGAEQEARGEREAAERNRADAEELMTFMLGDLREKLEPIGKLDLLDLVATKAIAYYDRRDGGTSIRDRGEHAIALEHVGDVLLAEGHTDAALDKFRAALAITETLAAQNPSSATWQRDVSVKRDRIGDALQRKGDLAAALVEYRASTAISEQLLARYPTSVASERDLSVGHEKIGDVLDAQGHGDAALAEYRASLAITERLATLAPGPSTERDLSVGHERIGEILAAHGELGSALVEHRAALAIRERLVARDPKDAVAQRDLAGSHLAVGDVDEAQGDLAGALAEYRASAAIHEALVARDPRNTDWQSDLASARMTLAKVLVKQGHPADALAELRPVVTIQSQLAAADPTNPDRERDLVVAHSLIGNCLVQQHDPAGALVEYRAGLAIATKLTVRDPSHADWQRDVAIAHEKIGQIEEQQGEAGQALALADYHVSLDIRTKVAAGDPSNVGWQNDVAVSHYNIATILAHHDPAAALVEHRAAMAITEALLARDPHDLARQSDLADSHQLVAQLLLGQRQPAAAAVELRAAIALLEQLAASDRANDWQGTAAKLRLQLARCCLSASNR